MSAAGSPSSGEDRRDYTGPGLADGVCRCPWPVVQAWVEEAQQLGQRREVVTEPLSMAVATVDADGIPDVREVLCRFLDPRGPGFVTDLGSRKAAQLAASPGIAASLTWPELFRAIRFRGVAERIEDDAVAGYWRSRPRGSQLSHWASEQSHPIASRAALEAAWEAVASRFADERAEVPLPADFVGYRVRCLSVELWAGRPSRLHDRVRFTRAEAGPLDEAGAWAVERLQP